MFKLKKRVFFDCDEIIDKDLTCPICSETYDRSDRLPKLLNRCHTICLKCLEGLCSQSGAVSKLSFPCPICRRDINIPKEGASEFQTDPYLSRVLDRIESCEVTPECPKHPLEELQYCEPCDSLFCDFCDDKSHWNDNSAISKHSTRRYSLVMKRKSDTLAAQADNSMCELDDADKTLAFIEKKLKENSDVALVENDLFFTRMSSLLDERRREVSASISRARDAKLKVLHDQRQWITSEKAEILAEFKKFKHQGAISEVIRKTEELRMRGETNKNSLNPRVNSSFHYDEKNVEVQTFQKAISDFGGFRTSQTLPSLCRAKVGKCFARMCTSVTIFTYDFSGNNYWGNDLKAISATLSDSGKYESNLSEIVDEGGGTYKVQFVPLKLGTHQLKVTIFGCPIKDYPLEFEVESHKNAYYSNSNEISSTSEKFSICTSLDMQCVKLIVNQKEVRIDPLGWTLGTEPTLTLRTTYCQLLNTPRVESAASLDCFDTTWMCGENLFWRVNPDREKERVTNMFSLEKNLCCIELVPSFEPSSHPSEIDSIDAELQTTTCFIKEDIAIDEARSGVTFRHKFENLSQIKGNVFSPPVFVRNLPWRVYIQQGEKESVKTLKVYLKCDGCPESSTWSCKAEAEFRLIGQNADKPLTRKFVEASVFMKNSQAWGFSDFANWNDILDPEKGFIKDDSIILEVCIFPYTPLEVSKDSMEYTGYLPLNKKAPTSALLFTSISLSSGASVTNVAERENKSLSNQDSNKISASESTNEQGLGLQSLWTVWLGSQDGILYILSAEDQSVYSCIKMKLPGSIVQIIHSRGKVFIALANGYCYVFTGSRETKFWNLSAYFLIDISGKCLEETGKTSCAEEMASTTSLPNETSEESTVGSSMDEQNSGISCMEAVNISIWLAHRNSIHILANGTLKIVSQFEVGAEDAQIDQLTATEGGVWCSYRSQSDQMIQLFSAIEPYGKVMSIDIRPDLKKMLTPVLSDSELNSVAKITALKASNGRLWVGTAAGIILCIPFKMTPAQSDSRCDLSQAQLSLHGFGGAVKFFSPLNNGMISGGLGYRDLMIDPDSGLTCVFDEHLSHVIVWKEKE